MPNLEPLPAASAMPILLHLFEHAESTGLPGLADALRDHTPLHYVIHASNDLARTR